MSEKIRVLELLVSTDLGGGPIHVRDLIAGLSRGEFEITVAAPGGGPLVDAYRELGAHFVDLPLDRLSVWKNYRRVRRLIHDRHIQVVHSHGKGAGLVGRLAALFAPVKAVHTFHGLHADDARIGRRPYVGLERLLAMVTDVLIHVSPGQAHEAEAIGLAPPGRTKVIVNAIDSARVRALAQHHSLSREALGLPTKAPVLGTVARFDPIKALDVLVDAFARLSPQWKHARLLIVGDGPERGRLEALTRELKVADRVRFAGFIADAPRCMPTMDLYVSASRREGLPLSVLEAMACSVPVVATRVAGHVDAVEDGVTGLLVPGDDPAVLASAMETLLADPERRRRMGEAGRERVERHFSVGRMVAATAGVYRAAAGNFQGPRTGAPGV